jgi:hypothetical protein
MEHLQSIYQIKDVLRTFKIICMPLDKYTSKHYEKKLRKKFEMSLNFGRHFSFLTEGEIFGLL